MQQIDKVKHEGQILPNIDLSKQSPLLCCPDVTTVSVHYSKSNSVWKQLCHTVNIVATVQATFFVWYWTYEAALHLVNSTY